MDDDLYIEVLSNANDPRGIVFRFKRGDRHNVRAVIDTIKRRAVELSDTDPEIATIVLLVCSIAENDRLKNSVEGGVQLSKPFAF